MTSTFISQHLNDDVRQLALTYAGRTDIDLNYALEQIAGYQKARTKLPTWAATEGIVYPPRLALEQCSSEQTARYKAEIIKQLTGATPLPLLIDLTGGFGVDFSYLAPSFERAIYIERQGHLCDISRHNFALLGLTQAETVCADSAEIIDTLPHATLIYVDPARRDTHGRRTYAIADCTPDLTALKEKLLDKADFIVVKLSPMLDWRKAAADLGPHVGEIHIVSTDNECKELLLVMSRRYDHLAQVHCINDNQKFSFSPSQFFTLSPLNPNRSLETEPILSYCRADCPLLLSKAWRATSRQSNGEDAGKRTKAVGEQNKNINNNQMRSNDRFGLNHLFTFKSPFHLYLPNPSIMKAGCFDHLQAAFPAARQISRDSHIFVSTDPIPDFPGRAFTITATSTMNKRELKTTLAGITHANIAVRNFPLTADALRKKLKLKDGGTTFIFGTTDNEGKTIIMKGMCQNGVNGS